MELTTPRRWRLAVIDPLLTLAFYTDWAFWTTYHSILFGVSGSIKSYAGTGGGLTVDFHRTSDDKYLFSTSSMTGGGFTGSWYDSSEQIYGCVYENDTHLGRSTNTTASGDA
jgi:hypothetical protein